MPIPTNNSRPAIPYDSEQVLPNHNRYQALGKFPPTAQQLDGDFNGVVDLLNTLAGAINDTAAGIFPGADNPLNADKLPTTDGQGNVSWTYVTSFNLTDNAVQACHIQDAAITSNKIQIQGVGTNQIADGAVTTAKVPDNAVTTAKLIDNAVTTAKIVDGCLTEPKLADGAITAAKLADSSVTTGKLPDLSVTAAKVADNAITTTKILDGNVTTAKIADLNVTTSKLADSNVTTAKIIDHAVTHEKLAVPGQMAPFAMGYVDINGTILSQFNVASVTRTAKGWRAIVFTKPAKSANFVVVCTPENDNDYSYSVVVRPSTRSKNGFSVYTVLASPVDFPFNFIVYSF